MPIRAIITDYGGVLVQMVDETPRQELAERWGAPLDRIYKLVFDTESSIRAALGEIGVEQHWRAILEILHVPPAAWADFIRQFWSADGLNAGLVDYLRALRPHCKIGLLSNANDDLRQVLIDRWEIADLFDGMIISSEVGLLKPDPRIYRLAVECLGVQPEEAVFLDDMPENVEGARAAGLRAIRYLDNQQAIGGIEAALNVQP